MKHAKDWEAHCKAMLSDKKTYELLARQNKDELEESRKEVEKLGAFLVDKEAQTNWLTKENATLYYDFIQDKLRASYFEESLDS